MKFNFLNCFIFSFFLMLVSEDVDGIFLIVYLNVLWCDVDARLLSILMIVQV